MTYGQAIRVRLPINTRLHGRLRFKTLFCQNGQPKKAPKAKVLVSQMPKIHFNSVLWR